MWLRENGCDWGDFFSARQLNNACEHWALANGCPEILPLKTHIVNSKMHLTQYMTKVNETCETICNS